MHSKVPQKLSTTIFILSSLLMAFFIFVQTVNNTNMWGNTRASLPAILSGTANRPFVFRLLIPGLANLFSPMIPRQFAELIMRIIYPPYQAGILGDNLFRYAPELVIINLLIFLSLAGLPFIIKKIMKSVSYDTSFFSWIMPLLILFGIYFFLSGPSYYYDYPQMFLFTLALLFLKEKRWAAYITTLFITGINKETAAFLIPVFCGVYFFNMPHWQFFLLFIGQSAAYLIPRAIIYILFHANAGGSVEWNYQIHLNYISKHPDKLFLWLVVVFFIILFIFYQWKIKPYFLRTGWWIAATIFFVTFLMWGYPTEWRVFLEIYPITFLLATPPILLAKKESYP